ncbi:hypothetical protein WA026_017604 [Henosepilachna vigintioctopunctata]|uniref:Uncharacterized protein n=1 Tax=Henosepilachna vigintioctopunctata TaxID=420089 RepID=A0AAW1UU54_9CUCU
MNGFEIEISVFCIDRVPKCANYLDGEVFIKDVIAFLFKNDHESYLQNLVAYLSEEEKYFLKSFVQEDITLTDQQWIEIDSICEDNSQYVEEAPEELPQHRTLMIV